MSFVAAAKAEKLRAKANEDQQRSISYPRYVFSAYVDLVIPSLSSMGGRIPKGIIVPLYKPWKMVNLRQENIDWNNADKQMFDRLKNTKTKKPGDLAKQYFSPAEVIDWITREYGDKGAIEVTSLANLDVEEYEKLNLNKNLLDVFDEENFITFPTAKAYYDQFADVRERLKKAKASLPAQADLVFKVVDELEKAVRTAADHARRDAEEANNLMQAEDIKRYNIGQEYAFQFAQVAKRDQALNELATLQNESAKAALKPGNQFSSKEFIDGMVEAMKMVARETAIETAKAVKEAMSPSQPEPEAKAPVKR